MGGLGIFQILIILIVLGGIGVIGLVLYFSLRKNK